MSVVNSEVLNNTKQGYNLIKDRCHEILDWKNKNGECVFSTGGIFNLDLPISILGFFESGVFVTNGINSVLLRYSELESDAFKDVCVEESLKLRESLARGGKV